MEQTIMTKLLDGQEKMTEKLATVAEIVRKHDVETFPEMKAELKKQSDALYRMESKQNDDIKHFTSEKEAIIARLKPLEEDLASRNEGKKETKNRVSTIIWGGVEKASYIVIGYIITKIKYFQ